MKKFYINLILVNFILLPYFGRSQVVPNYSNEILSKTFSASPNASAMANYGNFNVNLFSGQPDINIELYKIKVDNFEMPINLKYNVSSVKPEEHPGWTGIGWNVITGGSITRVLKGGVDEVLVSNYVPNNVFSYFDNYNKLAANDWDTDQKLTQYYNCMNSFNFCVYPAPDEFVFNFGDFSGSFYKNHEGQWAIKSNEKIDIKVIESIANDYPFHDISYKTTVPSVYSFPLKRIIYGFELITDDGTKYIFGNQKYAIEFLGYPNNPSDNFHPNIWAKTWYLTKIVLPDKKEILFTYKSTATEPSEAGPNDVYYKAVFKVNTQDQFMYYTKNGQGHTSNIHQTEKSLERIYPVYLKTIETPESIVYFNSDFSNDLDYSLSSVSTSDFKLYDYDIHYFSDYSNAKHWLKLNDIKINQKNCNLSQTNRIYFTYLENTNSRLRLSEIYQYVDDGNSKEKYLFEYNNIALPVYSSGKIDHWGFYNNNLYSGQWNENALEAGYYNSRNSSSTHLLAETLNKITFPTGGYTKFIFEPHNFSKVVNYTNNDISVINANSNNEIGGGLRIKKIESYPEPWNQSNYISKEYFYVTDYIAGTNISSGVLGVRPNYFEEYTFVNGDHFFKLVANPILSFNSTKGSDVNYTKVVEKNQNGGFTEYTFSNHNNGYLDNYPNNAMIKLSNYTNSPVWLWPNLVPVLTVNSLESERGKVLNKRVYNNINQLIEKDSFFYNSNPSRFTTNPIRSLDFTETLYGPFILDLGIYKVFTYDYIFTKMSAYSIYTYQTYLEKIENYKYDISVTPNTFVKSVKEYVYSNATGFHQLKEEKQNSSLNTDSEKFIKKYYYSKDTEMSGEPFISDLNNSNMIGIPLRTDTYRGTEKLGEEKTQYAKDAYTSNLLLPKYIWAKKGTDVNAVLEKKITFDLYDDKGNLKQYTTELGQPVSIVWGYNKTLPIAKVDGLAYSSLPATKLDEAISLSNATGTNCVEANLLTKLDELRAETALDNSFITTYTYKPLIGLSTVKDPKGDKLTYTYDFFNRLEFVKDLSGKIVNQYEYHYKN